MQNQIVQQVLLQYTVDDDKLSKVDSASRKLLQDLTSIGGAASATSVDLARFSGILDGLSRVSTLDKVANDMYELTKATDGVSSAANDVPRLLKNIGASGDEIDRVTEKFKQLEDQERKTAAAAASDALSYENVPAEGLRRTGSAINQLGAPGIGNTIRIVGDIQQITREVDLLAGAFEKMPGLFGSLASEGEKLGGSWGALLAAISPFVILLGVAIAAWGTLQATLADANKGLQDAETSVESYFEAITKGTTDSLDKQISDAKGRQRELEGIIKTNVDALQQGTMDAAKQFGDVGGIIVTGFGLLGAFGGGLKDVTDSTTKAQDELEKLNAKIHGLELASESATVKFNTFVAKQISDTEEFIATRKQVAQFETMSADALDKRITDLQTESTILNDARLRLQLTGASGAEFNKEMTRLNTLLSENSILQSGANEALTKAKAREDAAAKDKSASDELIKTTEASIALKKQEASDANMSSDAQKKRLATLREDEIGLRDNINIMKDNGDSSKAATDKLAEYNRQLQNNLKEQDHLVQVIMPTTAAQEAYNQQLKEQAKALDDVIKAIDKMKDANTKLGYSIEDLGTTRAQDTAKIERDTTDKRKAELEKFGQEYIDLENKYADKRIEIARKAVESAQDDYTKLGEKLRDMAINVNEANDKDQRDLAYNIETKKQAAAKQEVDNLQQHLENLEKIRNSTYESDVMALLNVNFLQLAKNRLTKSGQIDAEDTRYNNAENKDHSKLAGDISDETRAIQHARDERLISYNQQSEAEKRHLADELAQLEVQKKRQLQVEKTAEVAAEQQLQQHQKAQLAAIQEGHDKQIRELNIHIDEEIEAKRVGYRREIQTILDEQKANMDVLKNFIQNLGKSVLPSIVNLGTNLIGNFLHRITGRDSGGPLSSFQDTLVNEPSSSGDESFTNSLGRTMKFPGFGVFTPLTSGTVNPRGGQGGGVQHNWYITGSNADEIAKKIEPMVTRISVQTFNDMTGAH